MPVRILVVDDHPMVRFTLREWLERFKDMVVVGESTTGSAALALISLVEPDVVLLDLHISESNGMGMAKLIRDRYPSIRIVVVGEASNAAMHEEAARAGAWAYVPKTWRPAELAEVIRSVMERPVLDRLDLTNEAPRPRRPAWS